MKAELKEEAIYLRRSGLSYTEILKKVPAAKSTLSLWLRSVNLSKKQKQSLTEKKLSAIHRGALAKKEKRLNQILQLEREAINEIGNISKRELLLIGCILYWAEGAKMKDHNISQGVIFSNSDPLMIKIFLKWLSSIHIPKDDIKFEIYIHHMYTHEIERFKEFWVHTTGFHARKFDKIYFKKDTVSSKRKNRGSIYNGLLRIKVIKSTHLNRRIASWIHAISYYCGVV